MEHTTALIHINSRNIVMAKVVCMRVVFFVSVCACTSATVFVIFDPFQI